MITQALIRPLLVSKINMSIEQTQPVYLIVGKEKVSPCDHETYRRFKLWVAGTLGSGTIDTYQEGGVTIEHWNEQAADSYPHLLNPCECGTFLPMEVEPGPMLSSSIGLLSDMNVLKQHYDEMGPDFQDIVTTLITMSELSLATNTALEIR